MRRTLRTVLIVGTVLVLAGAAIWAVRAWNARTRAGDGHMTQQEAPRDGSMTGDHATHTPLLGTLREGVTIDPRRQQLIGVSTVPVQRTAVAQSIRTVGVVRYDETRLADVNLKLEGWIRDLYVDYTGQPVRKGQPLFTLYSPELLSTEHEYLLALTTRDQLQQSLVEDARARADQLVGAARERLRLWDLSADQIKALDETRQAQATVTFASPADGFVIEKLAVAGMHVIPGQTLYRVVDLSVVWVEADVYENEIRAIRIDSPAVITVDAYPQERFPGRVIYVYPTMDERTRTVKVRFGLTNGDGRLKPGMYANVELTGAGGTGLVVPTDAVVDSGREQVVFVAQGDGYFEPRGVKLGRRLADTIEIVEGVKEGEQVATGATFFLDSESQLRASLRGYESLPGPTAEPAAAAKRADVSFRTVTDPPKIGDNQLEATVKDGSGQPIDDAQVAVQFLMPAMPTMNMPAMRSETTLKPAGKGVYRGSGRLATAGRWEVTVTATRGGERLGSRQLAIVVR